jgi:hypothetical protein
MPAPPGLLTVARGERNHRPKREVSHAFLCEDGDGDQYVIYLDDDNRAFAFAQNRIAFDGGFQEFTGATFSRDGRFLFVNT